MAARSNGTIGMTKRKANMSPTIAAKRKRSSSPRRETVEERLGIVQRKFYPAEMSIERAHAYRDGRLEKPIDTFKKAMRETTEERDKISTGNAVVHWFKCDLRTRDNTALHMASERAIRDSVPLICIYLISPQDFEAHLTSAVRVDFILRSLRVLQADLAQLNIPLYVESVQRRKNLPGRLIQLCKTWNASHLFTNVEYEVDELRREASLFRECLGSGVSFNACEDTCVVAPYTLSSLSGSQYSIYSPWYRAWLRYLNERPNHIQGYPQPATNSPSVRQRFEDLFEVEIPEAPANRRLSEQEKQKFVNMWPAGEGEAHERLKKFIGSKIRSYKDNRNLPAGNNTSVLSVHLAAGTLAARTCIREAQHANNTSKEIGYRYGKLDAGNAGIITWIAELAWRDFYKYDRDIHLLQMFAADFSRHIMCHAPWVV
ncbi:putative deoxyribodipyrimidine photo-lyase [Phaeomoniella chlamydospora]|uniref:Putative deoxyribodipyrimidine photo-lyase n=1 Tax=Phaeomoniella chlamydospora TaxID=158046 RepID=A0A0G2E4T2_PHACM|nr:putative deoxyribodipyrimidine photo-lyase [Phaeomoniella chlamydospora]